MLLVSQNIPHYIINQNCEQSIAICKIIQSFLNFFLELCEGRVANWDEKWRVVGC